MKYACKNCNFRYEKDSNAEILKCPYCGRYEAVKDLGAEELIEMEGENDRTTFSTNKIFKEKIS